MMAQPEYCNNVLHEAENYNGGGVMKYNDRYHMTQ